jgi:outer membrane immunogenic protein
MKKFLLSGAALLALLGGSASAADLPVKAQPLPPVPVWSWTGFYVGINGGYSSGSAGFTQSAVDQPGGIFTGIATNNSFSTHRIDPKGGLFGGQVGFNYQTGPVVWGVEGDWQWADQHETACGLLCNVENVPP